MKINNNLKFDMFFSSWFSIILVFYPSLIPDFNFVFLTSYFVLTKSLAQSGILNTLYFPDSKLPDDLRIEFETEPALTFFAHP